MTERKRDQIDTGAFRATLAPGRQDRSLYRLELVRVVDPTPRGGKVWRAQYTWPFPMGGLTTWEVQDTISAYDEKARRRYERKRRKMDERSAYREKRRRQSVRPPALTSRSNAQATGRSAAWRSSPDEPS